MTWYYMGYAYEKDGKKQYSTNVVVESFELLND